MTALDLGGDFSIDGWVAVNLNPRSATVVADVLRLPFRDSSIEELRAVDVLEHLSYRDTDAALAEWARVAMPGAPLYVQVPDADEIMRRYVRAADYAETRAPQLAIPSDQGLPNTPLAGAAWRLLGGHDDGIRADTTKGDDWRWNAHYSLFDRDSLASALEGAGWRVTRIDKNLHPNLLGYARRSS